MLLFFSFRGVHNFALMIESINTFCKLALGSTNQIFQDQYHNMYYIGLLSTITLLKPDEFELLMCLQCNRNDVEYDGQYALLMWNSNYHVNFAISLSS